MGRWMDEWMDGGWMDGWVDDGWMDDGWMDGWMDRWMGMRGQGRKKERNEGKEGKKERIETIRFSGKWDKLRFTVLGQVAPSTMGNSTLGQTVCQALKDLLKVKGIGLKKGDPGELFKSSGSGRSLVSHIRTSYRAQLGEVREGLEVCRTGSSH